MTRTTWSPDLLKVSSLNAEQLGEVLDLAAAMKAAPNAWFETHRGESLALVCDRPSSYARVSFAAAAERLGMLPIALSAADLQLGHGDTVEETARVMSSHASAIVVHTFSQALLERLAAAATVPVINAMSDDHHPCQALADLLTVRERLGTLSGATVLYSGDGHNSVVHSLLEAGALSGMHIRVACPAGRRPNRGVVHRARLVAATTGGDVEITDDPAAAATGADVVYTDVWVSMGEEALAGSRTEALRRYRVTPELMRGAKPGAIFMHSLPVHHGEEVEAAVNDAPASAAWDQAANRLPTEQAILHLLISGTPQMVTALRRR